jgi:anti-anti-sigma regulatory factor
LPDFDVPPGDRLPDLPLVVTFHDPVGPGEVEAICSELHRELDTARARLVICDVEGLDQSDLGTVDAIGRLALTARADGCRLVLRGTPAHLRALLVLAGLAAALPCEEDAGPVSALQAER